MSEILIIFTRITLSILSQQIAVCDDCPDYVASHCCATTGEWNHVHHIIRLAELARRATVQEFKKPQCLKSLVSRHQTRQRVSPTNRRTATFPNSSRELKCQFQLARISVVFRKSSSKLFRKSSS
jgi:hypothetical protein